ncbi:MAG: hypothetical protein IJP56_00330 [Synergistaceae bacterium]|nr:hypothetical protein [Synergistaceae bacterium]MBR0097761.1 hypothetical protein [Synergistaceae bacterium]
MKIKFVIATLVLVLAACFIETVNAAESRLWVCEYCGRRVSAERRPAPSNTCDKNHFGRYHSWQEIDKHGKNRHWICEYCGQRVTADSIPATGGCTKNPFNKRVHHWLSDR